MADIAAERIHAPTIIGSAASIAVDCCNERQFQSSAKS
jgi:hypothetical protein